MTTTIYILLGGKEPFMNECFQKSIYACSCDINPLLLISGLPHEVQYYREKIRLSGIAIQVYSSDKSHDTFTNFSKDISPLLEQITVGHNLYLRLFTNSSQAYRINKIIKYMKRWDGAFKNCVFDIISSNEIPRHKMESLANVFYRFGPLGMWTSRILSFYRKWQKKKNLSVHICMD
jgi:hypothetical protein